MRYLAPSLAAALALTMLGCGGSNSQSPLAPATPSANPSANPALSPVLPDAVHSVSAGLGGVALNGSLSESALAIYTLDIDPNSLTAVASLKATREAAANDDVYLLSIDGFMTSKSLMVKGISATAETVDITYTIEHPFKAAFDPAGQQNALTNRADLGLAGRVVFLADVPSETGFTFFDETGTGGDKVIANTALVANADAYYQPAGLLSLSGIANTFPYKVLVDETGTGSRVGVSNGGDPTGNFGVDGWTRDEIPAGWTGFGVLHQGQVSENTLSLRRSALSSEFSLDLVVLAKYNDPRGGANATAKKGNRLPPASADITKFAYRMPHGALDVEKIVFEGEVTGAFWTDLPSASTLSFRVTDSDAHGIESLEDDLAADPSFTNVAKLESGLPTLAVCIPGILGDATEIDLWNAASTIENLDPGIDGDSDEDSGRPGDALYFMKSVTKNAIGGQADDVYTGMVRVIDVEDGLAPALTIGLDENLQALQANQPRPVTYQTFEVPMINPNDAPTAAFALTANPILSATTASIAALSYGDLDGDTITVDIDWNGDGDFLDTGEAGAMSLPGGGGPQVIATSPFTYINSDLVNDVYSIAVRFTDSIILTPEDGGTQSLTVGANRPPVASGAPVLNTTLAQFPASFTLTPGTVNVTDPENDTISYVATASVAPTGPFGPVASLPLSGIGPFTSAGAVSMTLFARDASHQSLVGGPNAAVAFPAQVATLQPCQVAPVIATDITTFWTDTDRQVNAATNSQWGWLDMGSVTFPNAGQNGAVVVTDTDSGGAPFFPFLTQQFQRLTQPATGAPTKANMTAFPTLYVIDATTGRDIINLMPHQIEVDPTGRVLFTTRHAAGDSRSIGGNDAGGTNSAIYEVNGNLHTDIKFFDFNFDTNAVVSALTGTITTTEAPVAIALDPTGPSYPVYTMDASHVIRKYIRSGATSYVNVPAATMNIAPIIGSNTGTLDTNRKVHDFVYSAYNGAFYVLVQSRAAAVAGIVTNGYVYRIECDGTFNTNLTGPNTNPLKISLNNNVTQSIGADIVIDQFDSAGVLLTGAQDAQLVVCSYNNQGTEPEARVLNSNLQVTASYDFAATPAFMNTMAISYGDGMYSKGGNVFSQFDYWRTGGKPAGWQ